MSELKAYLCIQAREIEIKTFSCYNQTLAVKNAPEATMAQVYLKYEADKVIAEKDEKIEELEEHIDELQKATDSAWSKVNAMYDELRHNKYKRCLAMAEWCNSEMVVESFACFKPRRTKQVWREEHKFWTKWRKFWFELAMKFKEVK